MVNIEELKTTYKILNGMMNETPGLSKNTSFVAVKNYIANKICDFICL